MNEHNLFWLNTWLLYRYLHFYKDQNDKPKKGSSCSGISGSSELGLEVSSIVQCLGEEVAVTAGRIFHSLLSSVKLGKQSHCLLKGHCCVSETNVLPLGFLGGEGRGRLTSEVLSGFPAVGSVHRTLLPDMPVSQVLADSRVISALISQLPVIPAMPWWEESDVIFWELKEPKVTKKRDRKRCLQLPPLESHSLGKR